MNGRSHVTLLYWALMEIMAVCGALDCVLALDLGTWTAWSKVGFDWGICALLSMWLPEEL